MGQFPNGSTFGIVKKPPTSQHAPFKVFFFQFCGFQSFTNFSKIWAIFFCKFTLKTQFFPIICQQKKKKNHVIFVTSFVEQQS
jgi:hypothetical protein